jgi:CRP-like cAMP-binding protein
MATHPLWHNFFRTGTDPHHVVADLWKKTPLFSNISWRRCLTLSRMMHMRQYSKGELIFKDGEIGLGVAMIVSGSVHVKTGGHLLAELRTGDFFGEIALVIDEPRTANVIAAEETELAFFLRPDLEEFIDQFPKHGAILTFNLSKVLARRLREANAALQDSDKKVLEAG